MLNNKPFLRVLSLVVAILLWAYVMGEVDPSKTAVISDITVSFTNTETLAEEGLAPIANDSMTISAKIKGKRSLVNDVKKNGLSAYVDVSSCKEGKNMLEVTINTPDGISVKSVSDEYISFKVEEIKEANKPVSVSVEKNHGNGTEVPWVLSYSPEIVTVSGAASLVDKVAEIKGTVSADNLRSDRSSREYAELTPVDKNGDTVSGVEIQESNVTAEVRLLTYKTVPAEVSAENIEDGYEADSITVSGYVKIVASSDIADSISSVKGTVDAAGISDTEAHKLKVKFSLPEGVYLYNSSKSVTAALKLKAADAEE